MGCLRNMPTTEEGMIKLSVLWDLALIESESCVKSGSRRGKVTNHKSIESGRS